MRKKSKKIATQCSGLNYRCDFTHASCVKKIKYFLTKDLIISLKTIEGQGRPVFINEDEARPDLRSGFALNSVTILHS